MYGRGAAAGGEIQNTCLLQAAFKNRGLTHRQVGTVTDRGRGMGRSVRPFDKGV